MKYITIITTALMLSSAASAQSHNIIVCKDHIGAMNPWVKIEEVDKNGVVINMTQGTTNTYVMGSILTSKSITAVGSKLVVTVTRLRPDGEHLFTYTFSEDANGQWVSDKGDNIRVYSKNEFEASKDLVMIYAYDIGMDCP